MKKYLFRSWIPNTSGALSFSLFGDTSFPSVSNRAMAADGKTRYAIVSQRRKSLDSAIPFFKELLNSLFFSHEGEFLYICVAKGCGEFPIEDGALSGYLYIYSLDKQNIYKERSKSARNKLDNYKCIDGGLELFFNEEYIDLTRNLASFSKSMVEFKIKRNGEVEVALTAPYQFTCLENTPEFTDENNILDRDNQIYRIASQSFYFLRDLSHHHKNHRPKTDTIVRLHPVTDNQNRWKGIVLKELFKKVIEFKKSDSEIICSDATGIIPYIESFQKIAGQGEHIPTLDMRLLEKSLKANHTKILASQASRFNYASFFSALFFSLTGIAIGISSLVQILPEKQREKIVLSKPLVSLVTFCSESPVLCLAAIVASVMIWALAGGIYQRDGFRRLLEKYRDIQRLYLCLPGFVNVIIQIGFGGGLIYLLMVLLKLLN